MSARALPEATPQATVSVAGAFVDRARRVAGKHDAAPPAGEAHEVACGTAGSEPLMGEGVTQLVWVDLANAGALAPAPQHRRKTRLVGGRSSTLLVTDMASVNRVVMSAVVILAANDVGICRSDDLKMATNRAPFGARQTSTEATALDVRVGRAGRAQRYIIRLVDIRRRSSCLAGTQSAMRAAGPA